MRLRIVASLFALAFAGMASAVPIKFVYTGTGSGSLDGVDFSSVTFTITSLGDTDDRQTYSAGYFIDHASASIDISGIGTVMFTTATRTFVNNLAQVVGFSRAGEFGADLYNGPFEFPTGW